MQYHQEEKTDKVVKVISSCKTFQQIECCYCLIDRIEDYKTQVRLLRLIEMMLYMIMRKSLQKHEAPTN